MARPSHDPTANATSFPGISHDRVLLHALPSIDDLQSQVREYLVEHPIHPPIQIESQYNEPRPQPSSPDDDDSPLTFPLTNTGARVKRPKSGWQLHHVFAAIDKADITTLAEIRAQNFALLLQAQPGSGPDGVAITPMQYAMNLSTPAAQAVTLTLIGFLSRWVNHLDESVLPPPGRDAGKTGQRGDESQVARTRALHRLLRTNLRIAMSFGLKHGHLEPLASYVQILVMTEHATWLDERVGCIAGLITAPGPSALVAEAMALATKAIDHFLTAAIVRRVAEVQDYRDNAATDLLMMGCARALGNPIPASCFGRDERVLGEFARRLRGALAADRAWSGSDREKMDGKKRPRPRRAVLRFCEQVYEVMGQRSLGLAAKVRMLEESRARPRLEAEKPV